MERVILAYSGGLDTTVAITWIGETYNAEVVALSVDVGGEKDYEEVRRRALKCGAVKALVVDAKQLFVDYFVFPALRAGAVYQGQYPLATALSRPLIAKLMVDAAREHGATAVAHGCTGKGNDQVRFDVSVGALAPDLKVIAPAREWKMTRAQEVAYAKKRKIPLELMRSKRYSVDENLWGRSIEGEDLEDPWNEPPEAAFAWTVSPAKAPDRPEYVEIAFQQGTPVSVNGQTIDGFSLVRKLNALAGKHGVGRIDHIEDRLVGIKSREVYEAPAGTVLLKAHAALEAMTLSKDQLRFKAKVAQDYAELVYNGLWFTALHQDLAAYVQSTQRHVNGVARVKLHKGACTVVGRNAERSLYRHDLATYGKGDSFDAQAAVGFINISGLPVRAQAQVQLLAQPEGRLGVIGSAKGGK